MPPFQPRLALLLLALALLVSSARAGDLSHFEDASLHAVHFLDAREGWAVGDDGVVWHTNDGGDNWERQPSGVRASLRSVFFLDPATGWAVGREEPSVAGTSVGVVLFTQDGGWTWQRMLMNSLPGLHQVNFVDEKVGYLAGEGSDQYPSGVFQTRDGGHSWKPVPGPRCPAWFAADFDAEGGALAGAWNRLATLRRDRLFPLDMDTLGGRNLRGLQLRGGGGVAVGDGGLVLLSPTRGSSWAYAEINLPPAVRAAWDFHAVHGAGPHVWAVGRPGSVALHSADGGKNWEVVKLGQGLPLHAVFFRDEKHGWAAGELGTILATRDGGKTWAVQRRGGLRASVLFAHARPAGLPVDTVALLGGQEGYLSAALSLTGPDPSTASQSRATDAQTFAAVVRQVGGASAESLWQFPLPSHLAGAERAEILQKWDALHGERSTEQLLRQVVLALRMWRPDVVITDQPASSPANSVEGLVTAAVLEAFERAADPAAFPEQIEQLGLQVWKPAKLYSRCEGGTAHVALDLDALSPGLGASCRDIAAGPGGLLGSTIPAERRYRLLATRLEGAAQHRDLMQGIDVAPGGQARRPSAPVESASPEVIQAARTRATLRTLVETPPTKLTDPDRLLARIGPMVADLPEQQAAPAAYAAACHYARAGQWTLAREAFLLVADRYPTHPAALESLRWLVRHNASSEARRRHELGQFVVVSLLEMGILKTSATGKTAEPFIAPAHSGSGKDKVKEGQPKKGVVPTLPETKNASQTMLFTSDAGRKWYQGSVDLQPRLAAFGSLHASDPSMQFCLQAARRNLGDFEKTRQWYEDFAQRYPDSPWQSIALAECWLASRAGPPPRPVLVCRAAEGKPYLDGQLDEPCWQAGKAQPLLVAAGSKNALTKEYPTEVRMTYDADFLYLAVHCAHPAGQGSAPAATRTRDADMRGRDRVSLLLDLDRDYSTFFHLQVDASGCVAEDCWGDRSWNPRWFVAVHREPTSWTVEAAIPMSELTGDRVSPGQAWAVNVIRSQPGRGVQALALPAEAPEMALRPEGMGLLLFAAPPQQAAGR